MLNHGSAKTPSDGTQAVDSKRIVEEESSR